MNNYIFDKRVIKKNLIKFLVEAAVVLPILILISFLLTNKTADWVIILLDVVVGLALIFALSKIYDIILTRYKEKKLKKLQSINNRIKEERIKENNSKSTSNKTKEVVLPKKKRKRRNRKENINGKSEN